MDQITVNAGESRPTTTGVEGAVDVPVEVTLPDGRVVRDEVTLCPAEDGRPCYESWGTADMWVGGELLAELYAAYEGDDGARRDALSELSAVAGNAAGRP
jgi:hypothetical protein